MYENLAFFKVLSKEGFFYPSVHPSFAQLTLPEPTIGQPVHMERQEVAVPGIPVVFPAGSFSLTETKPVLKRILDTFEVLSNQHSFSYFFHEFSRKFQQKRTGLQCFNE